MISDIILTLLEEEMLDASVAFAVLILTQAPGFIKGLG
jgi:hypothetical protein